MKEEGEETRVRQRRKVLPLLVDEAVGSESEEAFVVKPPPKVFAEKGSSQDQDEPLSDEEDRCDVPDDHQPSLSIWRFIWQELTRFAY